MEPMDPGIVALCVGAALLAIAFWRLVLTVILVCFVTLTLVGFGQVWVTMHG